MRHHTTPIQWTIVSLLLLVGYCSSAWGQGMLENPAANSSQAESGLSRGGKDGYLVGLLTESDCLRCFRDLLKVGSFKVLLS